MANTSDLVLKNTDNSTKSNYSLINDIATAVQRINEKTLVLAPTEEFEIDAEDGYSYFCNVSATGVTINLPDSALNLGMKIYAKNFIDGGLGSVILAIGGGDKIDGVSASLTLGTAGDYAELVATTLGWITKYSFID